MKKLLKNVVIYMISLLIMSPMLYSTVSAQEKTPDLSNFLKEGYEILETFENYAVIGKPIDADLIEVPDDEFKIEPNANLGVSISVPRLIGYTHDPYRPIRSDSLVGGGSSTVSPELTVTTTVRAEGVLVVRM